MPLARLTLAASAAALLIGGVAFADPAMSPDPTAAPPPATDQSAAPMDQSAAPAEQPAAPADQSMAPAATGSATDSSANVGVTVVASQPVPDTPENRARYGQPMSHAGKHTAARGN